MERGQFDGDAAAERVAEDVHVREAQFVQVAEHGIADRGDGRAALQRCGSTVPGEVRGQHAVAGFQLRTQWGEVVVRGSNAMQ